MSKLKKTQKVSQNPDIIDSEIDDEVVMMNVEKGSYFGLDPVGSIVWKMLAKAHSLDDAVDQLTLKYDVSAEQCKTDIEPFIERLMRGDLLIESE